MVIILAHTLCAQIALKSPFGAQQMNVEYKISGGILVEYLNRRCLQQHNLLIFFASLEY